MANISKLVTEFKKEYGPGSANQGGSVIECERASTGIFELDLAMGGGFPKGCLSIVYGPESSGKTNIVLKTIAQHQKAWPNLLCVFVDVEHSLDIGWAKALGVDIEKLVLLEPDYAEQAVDMIEGVLGADDCGIVALDSVAAMVTQAEVKKSAEDGMMGGSGVVMSRLSHKSLRALSAARKEGRTPSLIYINQTRYKVGMVFGDPEKFPGGDAQKFQSQMTLRVAGKNIEDKKINKVMPIMKETSFVIKKWKAPIVATHGLFRMVTLAHEGFLPGEINDLKTLLGCLKSFGLATKVKGGWHIDGVDDVFSTNDACMSALHQHKIWAADLRHQVIEKAKLEGINFEEEDT